MKNIIRNFLVRVCYSLVKSCIKEHKLRLNTILVLAPHPDDEIIGLGGIIIETLQKGGEVHIVYLTHGEGSEIWYDREEIKKQRINLSLQVCQQLGVSNQHIHRLYLADGAVPFKNEAGFQEAVRQVKQLIDTIKPEAVFATSDHDLWPYDHLACAQISREALEQAAHKAQLWYYWVWAWYHLKPWHLHKIPFKRLFKVNISPFLVRKKYLYNLYLNALAPNGKPWSGELPKSMIYPFNRPYETIESSDDIN